MTTERGTGTVFRVVIDARQGAQVQSLYHPPDSRAPRRKGPQANAEGLFLLAPNLCSRALSAKVVESEYASRSQQKLVWGNTGHRTKDAETSGKHSFGGEITWRKVGHSTARPKPHPPQHQSFCVRTGLHHAAYPKEPPSLRSGSGLCGKRSINVDALPSLPADAFAVNLSAARRQSSQSRSCAALRRRVRRRVRRGAGAGHNLAPPPRPAPARLSHKRPRPCMSVQ